MKKLLFLLPSLIVFMLAICACGHDDEPLGLWDPMEWTEPEGLTKLKEHVYLVPETGGTYTLTCRNYSEPWMSHAEFGDSIIGPDYRYSPGETVQPDDYNPDDIDWHRLASSWFDAHFDKADLIITVAPLPDTINERVFELVVTAGDIFDHFTFKQSKAL